MTTVRRPPGRLRCHAATDGISAEQGPQPGSLKTSNHHIAARRRAQRAERDPPAGDVRHRRTRAPPVPTASPAVGATSSAAGRTPRPARLQRLLERVDAQQQLTVAAQAAAARTRPPANTAAASARAQDEGQQPARAQRAQPGRRARPAAVEEHERGQRGQDEVADQRPRPGGLGVDGAEAVAIGRLAARGRICTTRGAESARTGRRPNLGTLPSRVPTTSAILYEAMPIYEYRCQRGHTFEVRQKFSDDPVSVCEGLRQAGRAGPSPGGRPLQGLRLLQHRWALTDFNPAAQALP